MDIKTRKVQIVSEVDECIAELTDKEVAQAIKEYVERTGPEVVEIAFKTRIEAVHDEWGIPSGRIGLFIGANVVVKPSVHKG